MEKEEKAAALVFALDQEINRGEWDEETTTAKLVSFAKNFKKNSERMKLIISLDKKEKGVLE